MLESVKNNWSTRELERQINSLLYERLALSKDREKVLEFYNYVLKCFVLIDLKVGKLTHQDIGQMDFYVRYFEKEVRSLYKVEHTHHLHMGTKTIDLMEFAGAWKDFDAEGIIKEGREKFTKNAKILP